VAVDHAPTDWRAHSWLGKVLFEIGRSEEALDCYRRVIELVPDSARGRRNLGTMLYRLDRLAEAADHYRAAIAIQPDALSYSNLGTALYFMSDYDGAATAFRRAVDLRPEEPLLWGNLGNACHWIPNLRAEGDAALDRAIALTLERLDRDSVDAMGQARLAGWLANRGDLAGAESAISHALDMKPDDNECLVRAGHVYFQLGRKEQAIEFFRRAIERGYGREELRRSRELAELLRDPAFRRLVEREQA
jgi:serine/threonine-protein kinase